MLLVNKLAVTFLPVPTLVTSLQYMASAFIIYVLANCCRVLEADTVLKWQELRRYFVIPFLFSLAIFSNIKLLESANVETFMVFRFSTPLFVSLVDFALMGKSLPSLRTWFSFTLIISGAIIYAYYDAGFSIKTVCLKIRFEFGKLTIFYHAVFLGASLFSDNHRRNGCRETHFQCHENDKLDESVFE